jgi:succinate dehydrogenase/fumarate reductase flavoprotein subunit
MVRAYLDNGPQMVEFLQTQTEMRFFPAPWYVDYNSELAGAGKTSRSIGTVAYHGRALGPDIALLRRPHPQLVVLGESMMGDIEDIQHFLNARRSIKSFLHAARRIVEYGRDRLLHGRGMRLAFGNALIARMLKSARNAGVEIWVNAPATRLVKEGGRIVAVEVCRDGKPVLIPVRSGVVLASGGFAHDAELRSRYLPFPDRQQSATVETNQGDAARMAMSVGAAFKEASYNNYVGTAISVMRNPDGSVEQALHSRSLGPPGIIAVDGTGRRFANESLSYNDFMHAMIEARAVPTYAIADHRHLRRHGFGLVRHGPAWMRPLGRYIKSGYLMRARSIAELASKIGVPPDNLEQTVARFNKMALAGKDLDFHKGERRYDVMGLGPSEWPNPCLGPIDSPPYYAVRLEPGNTGTFAGLVTDASARVLDAAGQPIAGLYACGLDMLNAFSGRYPGGGGSVGPSMVFGFIAARDIATRAASDLPGSQARPGLVQKAAVQPTMPATLASRI